MYRMSRERCIASEAPAGRRLMPQPLGGHGGDRWRRSCLRVWVAAAPAGPCPGSAATPYSFSRVIILSACFQACW